MKKMTLQCVHNVPGRLRLKGDRHEFNGAAAEALRRALQPMAGVLGVQHRALTGSIVIDYQPHVLSADKLFRQLAALGVFITDARPTPEPVAKDGSIGQKMLDLALQTAVEKVLEQSVFTLIAAII